MDENITYEDFPVAFTWVYHTKMYFHKWKN